MSLFPSDPRKVRSDPEETQKKRPLESNGQTQEDKVAHHTYISADGEEPMNVKSIRCQCTVKQKKRVVLYNRVRPTELRKFGIPQKNIQQWLKSFYDRSHTYL